MYKSMRIPAMAALLSVILLIAACGGTKGMDTIDPQSELEETPEPIEETPEPTPSALPYYAPLTGLGREQEALNRPIAVMINNFSAARPQSGLTNADVIWEVLAEGGITRLVAIFQSTDALTDTVGPIRSNRAYLIDIADSYGAVMAHAGSSPEGYGILQKQKKPYLDEITNAGSYFWRSKERKAPHNLYSDLEKLRTGADKKGYRNDLPVPKYSFAEEGIAGIGEPATDITITFLMQSYKVGYTYVAESGLYKRTINEKPHIDMNNDEQLSATNLVVFETGHKTLDNEGRLAVDLTSGGAAYLFQKGKVIEAEWLRSSDGMIRIVKNGVELPYIPGKTFIHIVPNKPSLAEHVTWVQK